MNDKVVKAVLIVGAITVALFAGRAAMPSGSNAPDRGVADVPPVIAVADKVMKAQPLAGYAEKGLAWLAEAQHQSGGWGGGSHSAQQIKDPHAVVTDPGTTAFAAMAFLRAGHGPTSGKYKDTVLRSLEHILGIVEAAPAEGPKISDVTGTQPQAKMGQYVDTALCSQFLTRVLPEVKGNAALEGRVSKAIDKCVAKIQKSQSQDGTWKAGGWAPVLQSSLMNASLEMAQAANRPVDAAVLDRSRDFQKRQVDEVGAKVTSSDAAGIGLYALSSNMRSNAAQAEAADQIIADAKKAGRLGAESRVSYENLVTAGVPSSKAAELDKSHAQNVYAVKEMNKDEVLAGFGSNGGEEFLSYMQKSEALLISGGNEFATWNAKMAERLMKIQNGDGSWSGHHCISSPVFCTAAVLMTVAAERDADLLRVTAKLASK